MKSKTIFFLSITLFSVTIVESQSFYGSIFLKNIEFYIYPENEYLNSSIHNFKVSSPEAIVALFLSKEKNTELVKNAWHPDSKWGKNPAINYGNPLIFPDPDRTNYKNIEGKLMHKVTFEDEKGSVALVKIKIYEKKKLLNTQTLFFRLINDKWLYIELDKEYQNFYNFFHKINSVILPKILNKENRTDEIIEEVNECIWSNDNFDINLFLKLVDKWKESGEEKKISHILDNEALLSWAK